MDDRVAMSRRIWRLGNVLLLLFILLAGFQLYWQVIDASTLVARPDNPRQYAAALAIRRGAMLDRMGQVLVSTTFDNQGIPTRTYTSPSLAPVTGYHSLRYGDTGLEAAENDFLSGNSTLQPLDQTWQHLLHEPVVGATLHLTIDARIQTIAAQALGSGPGVAIVSDPRTGAILAMVSQPTFDPNRIDAPGYWDSLRGDTSGILLNRATQGLYPPGSTFKTVTLAAALQSGAYSLGSQFVDQQATGPLVVQGYLMPSSINNLPYGVNTVTLQQAYQYSDNIVFAEAGMKLGGPRLLAYAGRFGFGQQIPFDLPVIRSSVTQNPDTFTQLDAATSAFGQDRVLATPLQMLMVTNAIAGHGQIKTPYLVSSVTAPDGETLASHTPSTWLNVIGPAMADRVGQAMQAVVQSGSGVYAQVPGIAVAGKTGTAQTMGRAPHAWFIGYAPANNPRLSIVVLKENAGEGSTIAAPIAGQILRQALPLVP